VIDNLGFHLDSDFHTELAALRKEIDSLTLLVTQGAFHSYEAGWNTRARLDGLLHQETVLAREAAMEDQRIQRLADAVQLVGDAELGFIAYVAFGPAALPLETLYEVRLIDSNGYTVPGTVRTNLPASRLDRAKTRLMTVDGPEYARQFGYTWRGYHVQVTPF
jgi:hypothetical protein